jgi:ribonucleoside-triphosphate reductase
MADSNALADYVFTSKYSAYRQDLGRRETYEEAIEDVIKMHQEHFESKGLDVADFLEEVRLPMLQKKILGSQRALQFKGRPIHNKNARIYNCAASYCDRPEFFQELTWVLLCGCGAGFSVQKQHITKLPKIRKPRGNEDTYVIPDTIEGWGDAFGILMSSYFVEKAPFPKWTGVKVDFNFSEIRPKGSPISTGGKAPGPEPLERSLELCRNLLDRLCENFEEISLRPIDAYDISMHIADAVISGGVRRSACLCAFSQDDEEMLKAKTGRWTIDNPQRGRSNNSVMLLRDEVKWEEFAELIESTKQFGEPGFLWVDDLDVLFNPCVEIGLFPKILIDGIWKSGWAFCNLTEINVATAKTEKEFLNRCRYGSILGTLQADYTDFGYLGPITEAIVRKEALLGVSMTGIMDNPNIALNPELQRRGAQTVLDTNKEVANRIGIELAARTTCVKPAGSTSCVLGVVSSGIHYHHSRRYFRTVQSNKIDPVAGFYASKNPITVEESVWSPNKTDLVLTFRIEVDDDSITKDERNSLNLLEAVLTTQKNWVLNGRRPELCPTSSITHNVSNTIDVGKDEWIPVAWFIYKNREFITGMALLSDGGDLDFPQAPLCKVLSHNEIVDKYGVGAIMSSGLIVDGLHAFDDDLWAACACVLGIGEKLDTEVDKKFPKMVQKALEKVKEQRKDWIRRAYQFAERYFLGDVVRMTRCLKRVHNCKRWEDLRREVIPVDFKELLEDKDNTVKQETIACAGGTCSLSL